MTKTKVAPFYLGHGVVTWNRNLKYFATLYMKLSLSYFLLYNCLQ